MNNLDSACREHDLHKILESKPSLRMLYAESYQRFTNCICRCPGSGQIVEIGSGASFAKQIIPNMITSDIIPYKLIDVCFDATEMPFKDESLRAIFMLNTLHHIPNVEFFFREVQRCLKPNGRIFIVDHYLGWLSHWIYKYIHNEPFSPKAKNWDFESTGPLSGANSALCWIVFFRDREKFSQLFPRLSIDTINPHSPFCYWLTGGLKKWCLLPKQCFNMANLLDNAISKALPKLSSFVDIELARL